MKINSDGSPLFLFSSFLILSYCNFFILLLIATAPPLYIIDYKQAFCKPFL
ncbi:hypothetical protein [Enterococcus phage vB_Efs8_KEN04]